jgi:hypothetical protein
VVFIYGSVSECRKFVTENKLCPQCREWLTPTGDTAMFAVPEDATPEDAARLDNLKHGDAAFLKDVPRLADGAEAGEWLTATCHACSRCEGLSAHITVTYSVVEMVKKKPQIKTTVLAHMVEISPDLEAALFAPAKPAEVPSEEKTAPTEA